MKWKGKKVLVLGMGASGKAAAHLLRDKGARVMVGEKEDDQERRDEAKKLTRKGIKVVLGPHPLRLLQGQELIVLSPGVPLDIPLLQEARKRDIQIIGELELAFRFLRDRSLIAITGTNGKSTTVILTQKILRKAGRGVRVAGNDLIPLSEVVGKKGRVVVVEVSSFQLETIERFSPFVSSILNLSPDHLYRHLDLKKYIELKSRIFLNQKEDDFVVLNRDDSRVYPLAKKARARAVFFSQKEELKEGIFLKGNEIIRRWEKEEKIASREDILLPGSHNLDNVLCSIAISSLYGIRGELIRQALREFKGLPHRMELVDGIGGVEFINDSKATNEEAVKRCLDSMRRPVILIMGGRDKGTNFSHLRGKIRDKAKKVILLGEAREKIKKQLANIHSILKVEDLREAVRLAFGEAQRGDCILLSPGCASFDQFRDYRERGDFFKEEVKKLRKEIGKR